LAPVSEGGLLPSVLAGVLGWKMPASARTPTQQIHFLSQRLRQKEMLLIFDNYEHLVEETDLIIALLENAPDLKILVTSRELLRLRGEWVVEIAGMAVPAMDVEEALNFDAPQLFLKSIARTFPNFQLANSDHSAVQRICQLVDGMPLALEMAGAWVQTESLGNIAAEIEADLDFLVSDMRDLPDRHRSVRAIFEHSWRLLNVAEQTVLGALSVFRGNFSGGAARVVAGCNLQILKQLGRKSLVMSLGENRFALHPIVIQFAGEKLRETEQLTHFEQRHARFYLEGVGDKLGEIRRGNAGIFTTLRQDLNELRQAWTWAFTNENIALLQASVIGMAHLYHNETLNSELIDRYQTAFNHFSQPPPTQLPQRKLCAFLLSEMLDALIDQGDYPQLLASTEAYLPELQALATHHNIAAPLATVYQQRGFAFNRLGDFDQAKEMLQFAIQHAEAHHLPYTLAKAYHYMSSVAFHHSDMQASHEYGKITYDIIQKNGYRSLEGGWFNHEGTLAIVAGDFGKARDYLQRALRIFQETNNQQGVVRCWHNLGNVLTEQGEYEEGIAYIQKVVDAREKIGDEQGKARALRTLGNGYVKFGNLARGKDCFDEATEIFEEIDARQQLLWLNGHYMEIAILEGSFTEATALYKASIPELEALQESWGIAEFEQMMGIVCRHLHDYPASEKHLKKAELLWQEMGGANRLCQLQIEFTKLALTQGDLAEAKKRANKALALAKSGGLKHLVESSTMLLKQIKMG
jgi:predicted ATPase/Tfp pilus assembly protein PilF